MLRKTLSISLAMASTVALLNLMGCSSDNGGNDTGGTPDRRDMGRDNGGGPDVPSDTPGDVPADVTRDGGNDVGGDTGPDGGGFPPAPAIGATQIDRMGRPAINTALTAPFYNHTQGSTGAGSLAEHLATQDMYNQAADPTQWVTMFRDTIAAYLGAYDSIDGVCGNAVGTAAGDNSATRYGAIATALADDRLFVDTSKSQCQNFLAVEADTLATAGLQGGAANTTDCGGRTPSYDTLGIIYSLISGAFQANPPIPVFPHYPNAATDPDESDTTFPWLADPVP